MGNLLSTNIGHQPSPLWPFRKKATSSSAAECSTSTRASSDHEDAATLGGYFRSGYLRHPAVSGPASWRKYVNRDSADGAIFPPNATTIWPVVHACPANLGGLARGASLLTRAQVALRS